MQDFDKTWFGSLEEKQQAAEKARVILEQAGMLDRGIESFLKDDELIWSVCDDSDRVLTWNERHPRSPLNTLDGAVTLACLLTDMS